MEYFFNYHKQNQNDEFFPPDSKKDFQKYKKRAPEDWIYRNKKIIYKTNAHGFRCIPLNEIDWQNSIVVFGCSNVFGIGLAEEDCLTSLIEKNLGIPTINLGIPGSAIDLACVNSYLLHKNLPHPKALIHVWTSLYRYTDFCPDGEVNSIVPRSPGYSMEHWDSRNKIYISMDRLLWRYSKTVYLEYSFFGKNHLYFGEKCKFDKQVKNLSFTDSARDLMHPGIESNKLAADKMSQDLKKHLDV